MDQQITPTTSYKEVKIGKTIYRVTSFFSGEKELGKTLEQLAVRRAMSEVSTPASCSAHYPPGFAASLRGDGFSVTIFIQGYSLWSHHAA